ncbi:MAG: ATP-binding protein [Bacteroidales bacterium]|nr:ATP-binding protein [Bacteroidales bacterium]
MDLRQIFQSLIALHHRELPYRSFPRLVSLPIDREEIITVTGVRRCGKSSILGLAANALLESGIHKEQILMVNFDDERLYSIKADQLDEVLQAYREMFPQQMLQDVYMFFDEIQLVEGWEYFVMRVYKHYCKHIFITGSTSKMLSQEINSVLRGWPMEFRVQPLNFEEYMTFRGVSVDKYSEEGQTLRKTIFKEYCELGGFPKIALIAERSEQVGQLQNYFNAMLFRDLIEHYDIKSSANIVRYFLKRVMDNLTKPTSINGIYNDIKSQGYKLSKNTLYDWIEYACNVFLFYPVPRYTKSLIQETLLQPKYYLCDHGMRNAVLLPQSEDYGKSLENIVFQWLNGSLAADDRVFYYKGAGECDFVLQRGTEVAQLVQVCWSLSAENEAREVNGLLEAAQAAGCNNCMIVTFEQSKIIRKEDIEIKVVPAFQFLSN